MAVNVADPTANDSQSDARHLVDDQGPGDSEDIRSQCRRECWDRNDKYPVGNSGGGNSDDGINERESADLLIYLSLIL